MSEEIVCEVQLSVVEHGGNECSFFRLCSFPPWFALVPGNRIELGSSPKYQWPAEIKWVCIRPLHYKRRPQSLPKLKIEIRLTSDRKPHRLYKTLTQLQWLQQFDL